jgi:NAD(P)-dependent dehydrogenase (short-subunit alcohol dehydrogenase family)
MIKYRSYFSSKVVIITGGGGGLGQALTDQLLQCDAKVAVLDLNIDNLTPSDCFLPIAVDITNEKALNEAIKQITHSFNRIDILFNNAGITHMSRFTDLSASLFQTIMDVNFTASVNITRLCLPYLVESKGQIIAISSVAGFAPLYGRSAYSASKHAMEGFFSSLGPELADDGVSVLIVSPSFVKSRPELVAQVNAGISSPGAMKKNTSGKQLSPIDASISILTATARRQPNLYLGRIAKIVHWVYAICPKIYLKLMVKQAKKEF